MYPILVLSCPRTKAALLGLLGCAGQVAVEYLLAWPSGGLGFHGDGLGERQLAQPPHGPLLPLDRGGDRRVGRGRQGGLPLRGEGAQIAVRHGPRHAHRLTGDVRQQMRGVGPRGRAGLHERCGVRGGDVAASGDGKARSLIIATIAVPNPSGSPPRHTTGAVRRRAGRGQSLAHGLDPGRFGGHETTSPSRERAPSLISRSDHDLALVAPARSVAWPRSVSRRAARRYWAARSRAVSAACVAAATASAPVRFARNQRRPCSVAYARRASASASADRASAASAYRRYSRAACSSCQQGAEGQRGRRRRRVGVQVGLVRDAQELITAGGDLSFYRPRTSAVTAATSVASSRSASAIWASVWRR